MENWTSFVVGLEKAVWYVRKGNFQEEDAKLYFIVILAHASQENILQSSSKSVTVYKIRKLK